MRYCSGVSFDKSVLPQEDPQDMFELCSLPGIGYRSTAAEFWWAFYRLASGRLNNRIFHTTWRFFPHVGVYLFRVYIRDEHFFIGPMRKSCDRWAPQGINQSGSQEELVTKGVSVSFYY